MPEPSTTALPKHRAERGDTVASSRDRALVVSALATVLARILGAAGTLISIGLAARVLGSAELGVITVLATLLVYFNFGDFGTGSMIMTLLPQAHARGDREEMRRIVSSALSAMVIVATLALVVGVLSIWVLPWQRVLGAPHVDPDALRLTLICFFVLGSLGIVGTVGSRTLAALQRATLIRVCEAIAAAVSVVAVAVCAALDTPIWCYLSAMFVPITASWLLQLAYVVRRYPEMWGGVRSLDVRVGARFLREGIAFAVLSTAWVITYTLDGLVVATMLGAAEAAVFSIAARLFSLVWGTLSLAGQQMWPAMSDALARGDVEWLRTRFRHSLVAVGGASAACSAVLVVAGPTIARYWVGEDLVPPLSLFALLGLWTIYLTTIVQYSYLLMITGRIWLLASIGMVLAGANLGLSILLTLEFGIIGPVIGSLAAACVVQLTPMILLTRRSMRSLSHRPGES